MTICSVTEITMIWGIRLPKVRENGGHSCGALELLPKEMENVEQF